MKKTIVYTILVTFLFASCDKKEISPAQAESFIKYFGNVNSDVANDVIQTNDDGYAVTGYFEDDINGRNITLIRTDKYGNQKWWSRQYGDQYNDEGVGILEADDKGFYILANREETPGKRDIYLMKTDANGSIDWLQKYGGMQDDAAFHFTRNATNGFIIVGFTENDTLYQSNSHAWPLKYRGYKDALVFSVDQEGNILWAEAYGYGSGDDELRAIHETNEGYIMAGSTKSFSQNNDIPVISLMSIQENGKISRSRELIDYSNTYGVRIESLQDNSGYILLGVKQHSGTEETEIFIAQLDQELSIGNFAQTIELNGNAVANDLFVNQDRIYVLGTIISAGNADMLLCNLNFNGNTLFIKRYGDIGDQSGGAIKPTLDGGLIITGSNKYEGNGVISLMKTDSQGEL